MLRTKRQFRHFLTQSAVLRQKLFDQTLHYNNHQSLPSFQFVIRTKSYYIYISSSVQGRYNFNLLLEQSFSCHTLTNLTRFLTAQSLWLTLAFLQAFVLTSVRQILFDVLLWQNDV